MPYWFEKEKLRVGKKKDRRRKLTDDEKELIRQLYYFGFSIHAIARVFKDKCTRRNIQFILFPERLKRLYKHRKEKNWYYDKNKHKKYIQNYRQHLKEIYGLKKPKI